MLNCIETSGMYKLSDVCELHSFALILCSIQSDCVRWLVVWLVDQELMLVRADKFRGTDKRMQTSFKFRPSMNVWLMPINDCKGTTFAWKKNFWRWTINLHRFDQIWPDCGQVWVGQECNLKGACHPNSESCGGKADNPAASQTEHSIEIRFAGEKVSNNNFHSWLPHHFKVALNLLQTKPSSFVPQRLDTLPEDLQARVRQVKFGLFLKSWKHIYNCRWGRKKRSEEGRSGMEGTKSQFLCPVEVKLAMKRFEIFNLDCYCSHVGWYACIRWVLPFWQKYWRRERRRERRSKSSALTLVHKPTDGIFQMPENCCNRLHLIKLKEHKQ